MEAAQRLKTEESVSELIQLVTFALDAEEYGVNVLKVREIIRMTTITRVPNTPPFVEGVINLRGKVIPVFSIRKKLGLADVQRDERTRIVVMEVGSDLIGIIVDAVSEVIRISESEIQPPPSVMNDGMAQECIAGVINQAERLLVFLEVEKLFTREMQAVPGSVIGN